MEKKFNQYVRKVKLSASREAWCLTKLPADFYSNLSKKYICVIFYPGLGEKGSVSVAGDAEKLLKHGPSGFVASGSDFVIKHPVTGAVEDLIIMSIQHEGDVISPGMLDYCVGADDLLRDRVKARFITGLSQGGGITTQFIRRSLVKYIDALAIKGLVPMSPFKHGANVDWFPEDKDVWGAFNATNTPVLAFCGANDGAYTKFTREIAAGVKTSGSSFVIREGVAHGGWKEQYDPARKWITVNHRGVNLSLSIYEWMLYVMPDDPFVSSFSLDPVKISITGPPITETTVVRSGPFTVEYIVRS